MSSPAAKRQKMCEEREQTWNRAEVMNRLTEQKISMLEELERKSFLAEQAIITMLQHDHRYAYNSIKLPLASNAVNAEFQEGGCAERAGCGIRALGEKGFGDESTCFKRPSPGHALPTCMVDWFPYPGNEKVRSWLLYKRRAGAALDRISGQNLLVDGELPVIEFDAGVLAHVLYHAMRSVGVGSFSESFWVVPDLPRHLESCVARGLLANYLKDECTCDQLLRRISCDHWEISLLTRLFQVSACNADAVDLPVQMARAVYLEAGSKRLIMRANVHSVLREKSHVLLYRYFGCSALRKSFSQNVHLRQDVDGNTLLHYFAMDRTLGIILSGKSSYPWHDDGPPIKLPRQDFLIKNNNGKTVSDLYYEFFTKYGWTYGYCAGG